MNFKYRIYHSEKHKCGTDRLYAISEERALYEYSHFPTALDLHFSGKLIKASCSPAKPDSDGMLVILETQLEEREADESLAELAVRLNNASQGLCLIIDKLKG